MSDASAPSSIPFASGFLAEVMPGSQALGSVAYWLALLLVTAGVIIIAIVCMAWMKSTRGEAANGDAVARMASRVEPASPPAAPTTEEAQNLLRLMGEAEEVCRRLGAELDAKAERVERLLAQLDGMMRDEGAARPAASSPASRAAPRQSTLSVEAERAEIVTRPVAVPAPVAPVAAPAPAASVASAAAARPSPAASQASASAQTGADALTQQVCQLADAGMTPAEIAKALGQHVGKVELILALRAV